MNEELGLSIWVTMVAFTIVEKRKKQCFHQESANTFKHQALFTDNIKNITHTYIHGISPPIFVSAIMINQIQFMVAF